MGAAAMNTLTLERIDLGEFVTDSTLEWQVPEGTWKIMSFAMENHVDNHVDYMEPKAVKEFMKMTYDQYAERFEPYFGNTITKTFFDDVGYYGIENYWNPVFRPVRKTLWKKGGSVLPGPVVRYRPGNRCGTGRLVRTARRGNGRRFPALRSRMVRPLRVAKHGTPPGNYEPTTVDMYGDPFKFYRHVHIPLMDAIHGYPYGRPGFKLIRLGCRRIRQTTRRRRNLRELFGSGDRFGHAVPGCDGSHGAGRQLPGSARDVVRTGYGQDPPLIAHYNPQLAPALPGYNDFAGRSTFLLQGGRRVADIALLFPIQSLEAWYAWETGRPGAEKDVPPGTDYNRIGDLLTGQIRQDFTFLHPEDFVTDKYQIGNGQIKLNTPSTGQTYKLLIMPSGKVLSVETLRKIRDYYRSGGKILATNLLPSRSAEFGQDAEAVALVRRFSASTRRLRCLPDRSLFLPMKTAENHLPAAGRVDRAGRSDRFAVARPRRPGRSGRNAGRSRPAGTAAVGRRTIPRPAGRRTRYVLIYPQAERGTGYLPVRQLDRQTGRHAGEPERKVSKLEKWNPHTGTIGKWKMSNTTDMPTARSIPGFALRSNRSAPFSPSENSTHDFKTGMNLGSCPFPFIPPVPGKSLFHMSLLYEVFGDLHGIQRRAFANLVADAPERKSVRSARSLRIRPTYTASTPANGSGIG